MDEIEPQVYSSCLEEDSIILLYFRLSCSLDDNDQEDVQNDTRDTSERIIINMDSQSDRHLKIKKMRIFRRLLIN